MIVNNHYTNLFGESEHTYQTEIIDKLAVTQSSPIVLDRDWTATGVITIPSGVTNTLDLNGHTITGTNSFKWAIVTGTFTLMDSSSNGSGKITSFNGLNSSGGCITITNGATFTMNGGSITNCKTNINGGCISISPTAKFIMNDGNITGCASLYNGSYESGGGGVHIFDSGSSSTATQGRFYMNGGTISGCTSAHRGGGVNAQSHTLFIMSGGTITGNTATTNGGGVYCPVAQRTITGGTISGNSPNDLYPAA